jgi:hypothetical protein
VSDVVVEGGATSADPQSQGTSAPSGEQSSMPNPASPPQGADGTSAQPPGLPPGIVYRDGAFYFSGRVNGADVEMPYEEAAMRFRTHESSTQRYQEAKRIEREVGEFFNTLKDPRGFAELARSLNMDPRQLAEAWLSEHLEDSKLTPEQKRLREAEAKLERYEQEKREMQERTEREQFQREQNAERTRLVTVFDGELDALGAPKGERVRGMIHQRMAQLASWHEQNGVHTTLSAIAKKARDEVMGLASEFAPQPPPAPPPPRPAAPPVAPPPPPANAQPRSQYQRDDAGRFLADPKPTVSANIPGSMDALLAWKKRHGIS